MESYTRTFTRQNGSMSSQPQPNLNAQPAMTTTYAINHNDQNPPADTQFYRSRTFNDDSVQYAPQLRDSNYRLEGGRQIYANHGAGSYSQPYYRRDSKGFRAPYSQPVNVDCNYLGQMDYKTKSANLDAATKTFAHPSSFPNYSSTSDSVDQFVATRTGTLMGTSERNRAILGDPLLSDPKANAHRNKRTVYKRAFGHSR